MPKPFHLKCLVFPEGVANHLFSGHMKLLDVRVYAIIQANSRTEKGCFVSNDCFSQWCGTQPKKIANAISRLKKMGFIRLEGFDGRRRYLRAVGVPLQQEVPDLGTSEVPDLGTHKSSNLKTTTEGGVMGFGMVIPETPPNEFDAAMVAILETAVRKLPIERTGFKNSKPSKWIHHLTLLRIRDKVPEDVIRRVMLWYADNIGQDYVPWAYSGRQFREKFPSLRVKANKDKTVVTEITPEAAAIAKRLGMLGWPKGSQKAVPGAAQACLTAYREWRARLAEFTRRLELEDTVEDYGKETKRLAAFGKRIGAVAPHAGHFVEGWLRAVHDSVSGWEEWSGDLSNFIFKPSAKRFIRTGQGWAVAHCGKPEAWDRFIEIMDKEVE